MVKPGSTRSRLQRKLAAKKKIENSPEYYTVDQIMEKAQEYVDVYDYKLAKKFLEKAISLEPDNVKALELTATLLLESGDVENAKHCLGRAVTVQPDSGYSKFFTLAQFFSGKESLSLYDRGINIVQGLLSSTKDKSRLKKDLSDSWVAIAELFMTDLCDEPDAEEQCARAVQEAVESDNSNPEAYHVKARLALVQGNFEDARNNLKYSCNLWLPKLQEILDNKTPSASFDPVEVCSLSYGARIVTAKTSIELEEFDLATQILEGLLEEDDEAVEPWYLLGWINRLIVQKGEKEYEGNARYYLKKASEVNQKNPCDDEAMIEHVNELLEELGPEEDEDETEEEIPELLESSEEEMEES